jgi:hypothetical protein
MSVRVMDATVYIAEDDTVSTSSSNEHTLLIDGDTIRLAVPRTISTSSDTGYPGEYCIDANYIYVCTAVDTWKRVGLSTFS